MKTINKDLIKPFLGTGHETGLTVLELLCVLAILASLVTLGWPGMQRQWQAQKLREVSSALHDSLQLVRTQAMLRQQRVTLCASRDGVQCAASGPWSLGWLVFEDANADHQRQSDEALIQVQSSWPAAIRIIGNTPVARYADAQADGVLGPAGTWWVCHTGLGQGWKLVLSVRGRLRREAAGAGECAP